MAKAKRAATVIPDKIAPMVPGTAKVPVTHPDWLYEIKWDGYRMIAIVKNGRATLYSGEGEDYTSRYKLVANEFEGQPDMIVDGELVVLDDAGKPDFNALVNYQGKGDIVYYVFDLLYLNDESWMNKTLIQRKEMLLHVLKKDSILTYSDHFDDGTGLFKQIKELGLEGIVAKRKESIYQPGQQSKDRLTFKVRKQRVVKKPVAEKAMPDVYNALLDEIKRVREKRLKGTG